MKNKTIKIKCIGAATVNITDITPFQGELKELSEKSYKQAKALLIKHGFLDPISVWEGDGDILYNLDGHQRQKILTRMILEGFTIPKIPINFVDCKNEKEAKEFILSLTSAFGEMSQTSLIEFCQDADIDVDEVLENYRFADINLEIDEDDENSVAKENDGDTNTKKATIKIKVAAEDKEECIEKIKDALEYFEVEIK